MAIGQWVMVLALCAPFAIDHSSVPASPRWSVDVAGVVRDARGAVIRDAKVALQRIDEIPPTKVGAKPTHNVTELEVVRTKANGAFAFAGVSNGRYQLLIAHGSTWLIVEGLDVTGQAIPRIIAVLDGKTRVISLKRAPGGG